MKYLRLLLVIPAILACSVKENRSKCLGTYLLDLSTVSCTDTLHISIQPENGRERIFVFPPEKIPESLEVSIEQGNAIIRAYSGDEGKCDFGNFTVSKGNEYPPLYISRKEMPVVAGINRDTLSLHKRFSSVSVLLTYDDPDNPYILKIIGDNDGYDAHGEPHLGNFLLEMDSYSGIQRVFNLPQQTGGGLILELSDPYSGLFRRFAIGQMIIQSGFDWNSPDLEDVILTLSYTTTQIHLTIAGWSEEYVFDINL